MHRPVEFQERMQGSGYSTLFRPLVFVVEDDEDIARLISHNLRASGFEVQSFVSGSSLLSEAVRELPALFLLDVMLPGTDGFELCRHIRQTPAISTTPIIFLTAKTAESDRIKGRELGGDDYITKPFSPRELLARIRSVLPGLGQPPGDGEVLRLGELEIHVSSMTVQVRGRNVFTTVREFRLLEYLATHRGRVMTRDQLLNAAWKETPFVTPDPLTSTFVVSAKRLDPTRAIRNTSRPCAESAIASKYRNSASVSARGSRRLSCLHRLWPQISPNHCGKPTTSTPA